VFNNGSKYNTPHFTLPRLLAGFFVGATGITLLWYHYAGVEKHGHPFDLTLPDIGEDYV